MPQIEVRKFARQPVGRGQSIALIRLGETGYIYGLFHTVTDGFRPQISTTGVAFAIAEINTDAQTTIYNPVSFESVGDVSIANDLLMTNNQLIDQ